MRTQWLGFVLVASALLSAPSQAAEEPASGRYTMETTDEGIVRLDTKTGAMSLCRREGGRWSCESMEDGQRVLMRENDRLEAENRNLRAQIEDMEETLGLGDGQTGPSKPQTFKLPSEQEVDKAFDYLEAMLKKLKDRMERLEEKDDKQSPDGGDGREL